MVVTVAVELVIGFAFAMVMHRIIFARGVDPHLDPDPLRHHHRGLGVRLAVRVQPHQRLRERWLAVRRATTTTGSATHWPAMFAIMVSEIWKTTPFMSLLLLAGLAQVSEDMLEAAKVDGATWWQRLWKVILPNMRAAIMVAVLFRALDAYRIFDNIFVMTKGAQDTESSSSSPTDRSSSSSSSGMGSALSVLLFLSVLLHRLPDREAVPGRPGARRGVRADERSTDKVGTDVGFVADPGLVPAAGGVDHLAVLQVGRRDDRRQPAVPARRTGDAGELRDILDSTNRPDLLRAGAASTRSASR